MTTQVAITLDSELLERLDRLVAEKVFPDRSRAVQDALREKLERTPLPRFGREIASLEAVSERAMADAGLAVDQGEWPEY